MFTFLRPLKTGLCILLFSLLATKEGYSWGFAAHSTINKLAVALLPQPLLNFFMPYQSYLSEHAVDPDKRRYIDSLEASRHYIDLEFYESQLPLDTIPHFWKSALTKYGQKHLNDFGSLPWQIQRSMWKLRIAFCEKNLQKILQNAAELGHYVADAHVPLHTTANYDGQLTQQRGIHALWETKIPDLSFESYSTVFPNANFWFSESDTIFNILEESHALVPMILAAQKTINQLITEQYRFAIKVNANSGKPTKDYANAYLLACERAMENSVSNRMRMSIYRVASCWLTCWILAGQPTLPIKQFQKTRRKSIHHPTSINAQSKFPLMEFSALPDSTLLGNKEIGIHKFEMDSLINLQNPFDPCRNNHK